MKSFFAHKLCLVGLAVVFATPILGHGQEEERARTPAQDETEFQGNSETAIEETVEQKDGKTVRKIRQGKVRQRKGEAQVGAIEDDEVESVQRRKKALRLWTFGFGPFSSGDVGEDKMLYGASLGRHWEVSTVGEITADALGVMNGEGSLWNLALGFSWLPLRGELSPVIGAGFGMGYADTDPDQENAGGFSGQFNAGLRMFRLADVQLEILATYVVIFAEDNPGVFGAQLRGLF